MKFHEDTIFKIEGQKYGQELIEIINIKGKILKVHQTEYGIVDPKMYKPDLVFELEDRIIILEFQSSYVDVNDKRRFRFYSAIIDQVKVKSKKPIEVHVLSTVESEKTKCYKINPDSRFPIYIHSLKSIDGDKFINKMNTKITHEEYFTEKELLMITLFCFMKSKKDMEKAILDSAVLITNIPGLDKEMAQFAKGIVLMLCDKFVKDETLNEKITNLVGGNMKNVEKYAERYAKKYAKEYAQDKVNETYEEFIINLKNNGFSIEEIIKLTKINKDFIEKTLAK
ncbi:MAG: hypothetical protein E7Z78_02130 [Methanobrevibacter thaueri]|uniref:hypothetical protein n=1 Tax=Methanobrevibacter thaueri TaxID=190975 RepID=UPI0026F2793C|nr:hypothetical protein [Methanobrevibacter thaueri]MBE6495219.1 hypothetical protein [Methanobrevibacter thaueri]